MLKRPLIILLIILAITWSYGQDTLPPKKMQEIMQLDNVKFRTNQDRQKKEEQENFFEESQKTEAFQKSVESLTKFESVIIEVETETEIYNSKRLYGPTQFDSRIEIAQLSPNNEEHINIRKISESVAMVIERKNLNKISENTYQLNITNTLGKQFNLCQGEAFSEQIVVGAGTAFIVAENKMMTASHVLRGPLKDYAVIFGYRVLNTFGTAESSISADDVYFLSEIIKNDPDLDITIFKTDRPIKRPILAYEKSSLLKKGNEIYMLGYPMGLPQKLAINANISDESNYQFFYTTLDSFQGNSGSPVFNLKSHKLIGVLVSGMIDYELRGDCYKSVICRQPYCLGEKVIRIELVLE
ncbi:serine protease [Flavobacterium johnsoniae]|uniref:trypsin-like serine peptidase n=1 Tax=Flavobacterium johnsoniae TaxID=986 RepID=UPI0025B1D672|nr:serine protease [Flavobacterium johnsoniae]WJS96800.1 serine protease [Flavobacterium johnsoniae]